ncbi:MAG TPA: hypothetical protein DF712_20550, partial [Balneola sp.]|nr:hypothetical protein [Balneola sp.]
YPLFLEADFSGGIKEVDVNSVSLNYGSSSINTSGKLYNFDKNNPFQYDLQFTDVRLDTSDVKYFFPNVNEYQLSAIANTKLSAGVLGNSEETEGFFASEGPRGKFELTGEIGFAAQKNLNVRYRTDSLNIGNLIGNFIQTTNISSEGEFQTSDYNDFTSFDRFTFSSNDLGINDSTFSKVEFVASGSNNIIYPNFLIEAQNG